MPTVVTQAFVAGTVVTANPILVESALSFLSFGVPPGHGALGWDAACSVVRQGAPGSRRGAGGRYTNFQEREMSGWLYLSAAIIAEIIGTSSLKVSDGFSKFWPSLLTIVAYGTSFVFLSLALRTIPVGIAYAVWAGVGIVLIACVGWLVFGQRLDAAAILGMLLIVSGVVVINVFSRTVSG